MLSPPSSQPFAPLPNSSVSPICLPVLKSMTMTRISLSITTRISAITEQIEPVERTLSRTIPMVTISRSTRSAGTDATLPVTTSRFPVMPPDSNVVDQSFNTYGAGATGGAGEFKGYNVEVNNPNVRFVSYSDNANGKGQKFSTYTENANAGPGQAFTSYGKNGNGAPNEFSGYGTSSNVVGSDFTNYGETANGANDTFKSYGVDGNVPQNNFINYGDGGNAGVDSFAAYREKSNVGDDSFQSYAKNSNAEKANFANYGKSFNEGTDKFSGYGKGALGQQIGFKIYGVNTTFKDYANKKAVTFASYTKASPADAAVKVASDSVAKNNKWIEPGKFFRESMLKKGSSMPMPDIRDKMPKRSFLPRSIISKLPFSTSKIDQLKEIFHASDNSSMERIILDALEECERAPSPWRDQALRELGRGHDRFCNLSIGPQRGCPYDR
ncbi:hypothetical protein OIU78_007503 [Salix suchowensis]|nr:hypothetical protein OIU78_007503 [Salix suchowensis]